MAYHYVGGDRDQLFLLSTSMRSGSLRIRVRIATALNLALAGFKV
jgi:hypothetical protein